jgi:hypothetical protein
MSDDDAPRLESIRDDESPVRAMLFRAGKVEHHPLRSLHDAQEVPDGVVILEGDYGGQIYVTCPAKLVKCGEDALGALLDEIDHMEWDNPSGAGLYYERHPVGAGVAGGMGGAVVLDGVWLHDELEQAGHRPNIEAVLAGKRARLSG